MSTPNSDPIPTSKRSRPLGRRVTLALAAIAVGIVLFVVVVYLAGAEQIGVVLDADPIWVAVSFSFGLAVTVLSAFRWGFLTNTLVGRQALRWSQYYASLLTSRVVGLFTPRNAADLGVRFVTLVKAGDTGAEFAAASVALDQLFDITLLIVWLFPSILLLTTAPAEWAIVLVPVSLGLALAAMLRLNTLMKWSARVLAGMAQRLGGEGRIRSFFDRRADGLYSLAGVERLTRRASLAIATMTFVRYVLNGLMFWAVAQALGLGISLSTFLLAGAVIQLSLVVAFTPGGLGIMDLGWIGALAAAGYPTETAAAFIVGQRAFQYTFFPMLAGVSYAAVLISGRAGLGQYGDTGTAGVDSSATTDREASVPLEGSHD